MSSTKSGPNRTNFLSVLVVCILQTRIDCMLKTFAGHWNGLKRLQKRNQKQNLLVKDTKLLKSKKSVELVKTNAGKPFKCQVIDICS